MYFKATMEPKIRAITYLAGYGLGLGVPLVLVFSYFLTGQLPRGIFPGMLVFAAFFGAYLYRPLGYEVDAQGVSVARPLGRKFFAWGRIAAVSGTTDILSQPCIGLWRSGGFYGVYGIFWTKKYGRFMMHVTDCRNLVEIELEGGYRIYVSPDEKDLFLRTVAQFHTPGA
jgi:hypothetical protein